MGINILPPQNTPVFEKNAGGEFIMRRPWVLFFQSLQKFAAEAVIPGEDITATNVNADNVFTDNITVANDLRAGTWTSLVFTASAGTGYLSIKDKNGNIRKLVTRT